MSKLLAPKTSLSSSKTAKKKTIQKVKKSLVNDNKSESAKRGLKTAYKYEVEFNIVITKSADYLADYHKKMSSELDAYGRHRTETIDRVIDFDSRSIFTTSMAQVAERIITSGSIIGHFPTKEINVSLDATTTELVLKLMGLVTDPPEDADDEEGTNQEVEDSIEAGKSLFKSIKKKTPRSTYKQRGRPRKGSERVPTADRPRSNRGKKGT
jgi:hypothetical protein